MVPENITPADWFNKGYQDIGDKHECKEERLQRIIEATRRLASMKDQSILNTLSEWLAKCDGAVLSEVNVIIHNAASGYRGTVSDAVERALYSRDGESLAERSEGFIRERDKKLSEGRAI